MKFFLLLILISFAGWRTGFSQTVQKQATQVITLRLMPMHVIELPTRSNLNTTVPATAAQTKGKWLINKQLLATKDKQATTPRPDPKINRAFAGTNRNANVVYTVTNL